MTSDKDEPSKGLGRGLSALMADIQRDAEKIGDEGEIQALRDRLDSLELLVEEFGQARELQNQIKDYVKDLQEEVADIRNYRFWVTAISVLMSVSLFSLLIACTVTKPTWFLELDGTLQVPLLVALGAGSVFLMSMILRGVYRSRHERHEGDYLPEAIKAALEAMKQN